MPEITKNQLKHIRLLKQKKYRQESGEFVVEGEKNVEELLNSNFEIQSLYATQDWNYSHESIEISRINSKQLSQLSNLSTPNKVFAIAKIPSWSFSKDILKKGITLVLDSINDPGNLGTIIRTADWFGVKNIICSSNSVDCFNPKVIQATKGSIFNVDVFYKELNTILNDCNTTIYGASIGGKTISKNTSFESPSILVMGSESHGISPELEQFLTKEIAIKKTGNAESLNVAIATSILLYELTK